MILTSKGIKMCDVCRLLDFNVALQECTYCSLCDAWICAKDIGDWGRRIKAFLKRKLEPGYRGVSNYEEMVKQQ